MGAAYNLGIWGTTWWWVPWTCLLSPLYLGRGTAKTSNPESPGGTDQKRSKKSLFPLDKGVGKGGLTIGNLLGNTLPTVAKHQRKNHTTPPARCFSWSSTLPLGSGWWTSIPLWGGVSRTEQGTDLPFPLFRKLGSALRQCHGCMSRAQL